MKAYERRPTLAAHSGTRSGRSGADISASAYGHFSAIDRVMQTLSRKLTPKPPTMEDRLLFVDGDPQSEEEQ